MRLFEIKQNDIQAEIQQKCSNYLKVYDKKRPLLHGTTRHKEPHYYGASIENRTTVSSSELISKAIDSDLIKLGVKARRLNSVYTTTDVDLAYQFGKIYEIFPINGFHYTWSRKKEDLVIELKSCIRWGYFDFTDKFAQRISEWTNTHQGEDNTLSNFDSHYTFVLGIYNSLKSNSKDSIQYYITNLPDSHPIKQEFPTILDMATTNINNLIKSFDLQFDVGLKKAIIKKHEIWLNGKYIAIEKEMNEVDDMYDEEYEEEF
jgi:hypothetical protein